MTLNRDEWEGQFGYSSEMTDEFLEWALANWLQIESLDSAWMGWRARGNA